MDPARSGRGVHWVKKFLSSARGNLLLQKFVSEALPVLQLYYR